MYLDSVTTSRCDVLQVGVGSVVIFGKGKVMGLADLDSIAMM